MQSVSAILAAATLPPRVATPSTPVLPPYVKLRCPTCTAALAPVMYHALGKTHEEIVCAECFAVMAQEQGIWLALAANREAYFQRFIQDYQTVRKAEGRGSDDPQFYLSLPYCDRTKLHSWQWGIRSRTYKYIERKILPALTGEAAQPLVVLDLGAGNGWLSYRLASLGHRPIAVDLQRNAFDGLGAALHYRHALPMFFPCFQAEVDRLPFGDSQFDCAIFNASFHYSENYDRTLAEAIRCLRPGGTIVIADSPTYNREEHGQQMVEERRQSFQKRFGFSSESLSSGEYLTSERLVALEVKHDLEWATHNTWYGIRWACRPLIAKLKRRREPSRFRIYMAQVKLQ
jgi:SAM-dependent methyltransferase